MAAEHDERVSTIRGFPSQTSHTLSALSGGAFVALVVVATLLDRGHPSFDDAPSKFVSFYADNQSRLQIALLLGMFSTFWLAWFIGFLSWLYEGAEKAARGFVRAAPIAFGGGIAGTAVAALAGVVELTAIEINGSARPPVTRMLGLMHTYALSWAIVLLSVFLLSSFFIIYVTEVLPSWMGVLAGVATAIGFFQAAVVLSPAQDNGLFGIAALVWFVLFLIYMLYASITLARRVDTAPLTR